MKKVLIIANLFHASPRIPGLAKYLPEFGWQSIILTTPIGENPDSRFGPPDDFKDNFRVVEADYSPPPDFWKFWERIFSLNSLNCTYAKLKAIIDYPDREKWWRFSAIKTGSDLLQRENIDVIISSFSPPTSHFIAKELKKRYKIPWVADFRDLWTQNHNYGYGRLRKFFEQRLELKTLSSADVMVAVSQPWVKKLKVLHKKEEIDTICNGFDPDQMRKGGTDLAPKFTITYTGYVYPGKQDPAKLFVALKDLLSAGRMDPKDIEVRFYGPEDSSLSRRIKGYGLSHIVRKYGMVQRRISFEKQRESQLLLLLNWEDKEEDGCYPLKIFEYLAAQRPILAIGGSGRDVVKELLDETKAGMYAPTVEDIKDILSELYLEYKLKGTVAYNGDVGKINKYSYREMARKFAEIFDRLVQMR